MFSVEKVGIDAGGIAPGVFELPADCAISRRLMSSMIAAVNKIAFVVRIVIFASLGSEAHFSLLAYVNTMLRFPVSIKSDCPIKVMGHSHHNDGNIRPAMGRGFIPSAGAYA